METRMIRTSSLRAGFRNSQLALTRGEPVTVVTAKAKGAAVVATSPSAGHSPGLVAIVYVQLPTPKLTSGVGIGDGTGDGTIVGNGETDGETDGENVTVGCGVGIIVGHADTVGTNVGPKVCDGRGVGICEGAGVGLNERVGAGVGM